MYSPLYSQIKFGRLYALNNNKNLIVIIIYITIHIPSHLYTMQNTCTATNAHIQQSFSGQRHLLYIKTALLGAYVQYVHTQT